MLIEFMNTPAFQTVIMGLGWLMLFLLTAAIIVLAAAAIITAIIRFFQMYWKVLAGISLCIVLAGVAYLFFVPV